MNETSKASLRRSRENSYKDRYFVGHGIDIGGGHDCLSKQISRFPRIQSVRNWDVIDGDAQYLAGVADRSFDFVYSSHCLEHMRDPVVALQNWLRILKPNGYLVISVPDEDLYEKGQWPSKFNADHKWSFTVSKQFLRLERSINISDMVNYFSGEISLERLLQVRDYYDENQVNVDQTMGPAECALEFVWRKRDLNPNEFLAYISFLEQSNQIERAGNLCREFLTFSTDSFEIYNHYASLLVRIGRADEALDVWRDCLRHFQGSHTAKLYHALFLISYGRCDEGFKLRELLVSDQRRTSLMPPENFPRWRGESLEGKSIVIWTEFGYGDEIMFSRFAPIFKSKYGAKHVAIVCQGPLTNLFKHLNGIDGVYDSTSINKLPKYDYWVFPHSIPVYFSLEQLGVPVNTPYFKLPRRKSLDLDTIFKTKRKDSLRVGIVYRGNPTHENDGLRSIFDLTVFKGLLQIPNIDWVDLQKESDRPCLAEQCNFLGNLNVVSIGDRLHDFLDTAQICSQLDLIIGVDTSLIHLAGALNIPTWLLLPSYADWRWGLNKNYCDWYPSIKIFRQHRTGNWGDVLSEVESELRKIQALPVGKKSNNSFNGE